MDIAIVTGSAGLIGAEAVRLFASRGYKVVGIDNNMREYFFGEDASTAWSRANLESTVPNYQHFNIDIRDQAFVNQVFAEFNSDVRVIIHTAAQPSHDWAASQPQVDFSVNANGTLNLLEACREFCPDASFVYTSTTKSTATIQTNCRSSNWILAGRSIRRTRLRNKALMKRCPLITQLIRCSEFRNSPPTHSCRNTVATSA